MGRNIQLIEIIINIVATKQMTQIRYYSTRQWKIKVNLSGNFKTLCIGNPQLKWKAILVNITSLQKKIQTIILSKNISNYLKNYSNQILEYQLWIPALNGRQLQDISKTQENRNENLFFQTILT